MYGEAALEMDDLAAIRALPASERLVLGQMLRRGLSAPITTSAGRLFDGVAALLGLHPTVSFEGQAAMALEHIADPAVSGAYPVALSTQQSPTGSSFIVHQSSLVLDWQPLVEALRHDLLAGVSTGTMAARFHNGLAEAIFAVAQAIGQQRVALTGGCFQNRLLVERTASRLRQAGFDVLLHRQVPPNDGGISLGQVAVAAAQLTRG
jgi:hydrogenase maturation protein HypF